MHLRGSTVCIIYIFYFITKLKKNLEIANIDMKNTITLKKISSKNGEIVLQKRSIAQ